MCQVRPLNAELAKVARIELNETPMKLEDGIKHLKKWIEVQPHIRAITEDQWLAAFLRGCKHSLERAKIKLDLYYSFRTISPDLFSLKYSDQRFKELLITGSVLILPKISNPTSPRLILIRPSRYDPNKYGMSDFFSFSHTCQQIMYLEDDVFTVNGTINIVDLKGLTMNHILQMTPVQVKKLIVAGQDASPLRLKGLYFINTPTVCVKIFNVAVNFLNEKNRKKVHVYSEDISELYKIIDKDMLPTEYGGKSGSTQEIVDEWLRKLERFGPWFEKDINCGTDESKRPGTPKRAEDMFGVDGSFRQLEVD